MLYYEYKYVNFLKTIKFFKKSKLSVDIEISL